MLCESRIVSKTKTKRQNYELKIVFIYNYWKQYWLLFIERYNYMNLLISFELYWFIYKMFKYILQTDSSNLNVAPNWLCW